MSFINSNTYGYQCDHCKKTVTRNEKFFIDFEAGWVTITKGASTLHACGFKCAVRVLSRRLLLPGWRERMARIALREEGEDA